MSEPVVKIDQFGWKYYDSLPVDYRLGVMEDFHIKGMKRVGMEYLIQRGNQQHFEIHHLTEFTQAINLRPYFDWNMIYVKIK